MVLRQLLLLALASAAALCSVRNFVGFKQLSVRNLQNLVKVARREGTVQGVKQTILSKDADGRHRFGNSGISRAVAPSDSAVKTSSNSAVLMKDSQGRYRFSSSKTPALSATPSNSAVLIKDSQSRYRFRSSETPAPSATPVGQSDVEASKKEMSAKPVSQSDVTASKKKAAFDMTLILGGGLTAILLFALVVGNLLKGPSEEELAQKRSEEAQAGSRTTFLFMLGGLAYINRKPGKSIERKSGTQLYSQQYTQPKPWERAYQTQAPKPKVVKIEATPKAETKKKVDPETISTLGTMWSGDSFKDPERGLDRQGFW